MCLFFGLGSLCLSLSLSVDDKLDTFYIEWILDGFSSRFKRAFDEFKRSREFSSCIKLVNQPILAFKGSCSSWSALRRLSHVGLGIHRNRGVSRFMQGLKTIIVN